MSGGRRQRGFALVVVLWGTVMLSLISATIVSSAGADTRLSANLIAAASVEVAADGAVHEAAYHLLNRSPGWAADGAPHLLRMREGIAAEIRITTEDGKLNPNLAGPDLLAGLLAIAGASPFAASAIADNIVQWRVASLQEAGQSAATAAYKAAGLAYGPPGAPFHSVDEVAAVLGMTPELFAAIRPFLSLYAPRDPDPTYASPQVRALLGADNEPTSALVRPLPTVVDVLAAAARPDGTRFVRNALIRLGRRRGEAPQLILTWEQVSDTR